MVRSSASDLEAEQALGPQHQDADDGQEGENLGHRAGEEELHDRLGLADGEGRGDGAEQARRAAEDDHQERVDDVELSGRRPGRADGLLHTSDAADDLFCVDLGGRRYSKKKNAMK